MSFGCLVFTKIALFFLLTPLGFANFGLTTSNVFKSQNAVFSCQKKIESLEDKEKECLSLLQKNANSFKMLACSIRSFEKISFPLIFIQKDKKAVQGLILLGKFFPVLQQKIAPVLPILQDLASIRKKLIGLRQELKEKNSRLEASVRILQGLIAKKYNAIKPTFPIPVIPDPLDIESCIKEINKFFQTTEVATDITIKQPVLGTVTNENNKIFIKAEGLSYIVSPWNCKVVNTTFVPEKGYRVILKQGEYVLIINGIGSLICQAGESLNLFEPIGQMPEFESSLEIELRDEWKIINPVKHMLTIN